MMLFLILWTKNTVVWRVRKGHKKWNIVEWAEYFFLRSSCLFWIISWYYSVDWKRIAIVCASGPWDCPCLYLWPSFLEVSKNVMIHSFHVFLEFYFCIAFLLCCVAFLCFFITYLSLGVNAGLVCLWVVGKASSTVCFSHRKLKILNIIDWTLKGFFFLFALSSSSSQPLHNLESIFSLANMIRVINMLIIFRLLRIVPSIKVRQFISVCILLINEHQCKTLNSFIV